MLYQRLSQRLSLQRLYGRLVSLLQSKKAPQEILIRLLIPISQLPLCILLHGQLHTVQPLRGQLHIVRAQPIVQVIQRLLHGQLHTAQIDLLNGRLASLQLPRGRLLFLQANQLHIVQVLRGQLFGQPLKVHLSQ